MIFSSHSPTLPLNLLSNCDPLNVRWRLASCAVCVHISSSSSASVLISPRKNSPHSFSPTEFSGFGRCGYRANSSLASPNKPCSNIALVRSLMRPLSSTLSQLSSKIAKFDATGARVFSRRYALTASPRPLERKNE